MDSAKCHICDSFNTKKIIHWENSEINYCLACKVVFSDPMPDEQYLERYYQGFMFNTPDKKNLGSKIVRRRKELNKIFGGKGNYQNFRILDAGGGTGINYAAAKSMNFEVFYQDLDQNAKEFVKQQFGLDDSHIVNNEFRTEHRFDIIFSDNVIEHVINPIDFISKLKLLLKDKGTIILKTPHARNIESIFNPLISINYYLRKAKKYNTLFKTIYAYFFRFWHCDPPRHLYSFSAESIKVLGEKCGFESEEIEIEFYHSPVFKFSFTNNFYRLLKDPLDMFSIIKIAAGLLIVAFEVPLKIFQLVLLKLNLISKGGLIIKFQNTV